MKRDDIVSACAQTVHHRKLDRHSAVRVHGELSLFTTPGVAAPKAGGFPAISLLGEFLLKEVPLLGLSFWTLADAITAANGRDQP